MKRIVFILFFLLTAGSAILKAQQVAIGTNALMWAALTPNLSCELVTGERTSLDLSVFAHHKPYGLNSKVAGFQPEYRYWFNGRPMVREYIGIGGLLTTYRVQRNGTVFDGDAVGLGMTFGYSLPVKKRFNIQFYSGFGALLFRQKLHSLSVAEGKRTNSRGYKLIPTKIGITLSYILK